MSKIRSTSFFVCSPRVYAQSFLRQLGYEPLSVTYWTHALQLGYCLWKPYFSISSVTSIIYHCVYLVLLVYCLLALLLRCYYHGVRISEEELWQRKMQQNNNRQQQSYHVKRLLMKLCFKILWSYCWKNKGLQYNFIFYFLLVCYFRRKWRTTTTTLCRIRIVSHIERASNKFFFVIYCGTFQMFKRFFINNQPCIILFKHSGNE